MVTRHGFALLAAPTPRTVAYLSAMRDRALAPSHVVVLGGGACDVSASADHLDLCLRLIRDLAIEPSVLGTANVNDAEVVAAVRALPEAVVVYSGPSGVIVGEALLQVGKMLLHVHPGRLPRFRGSTTIYYSLLEESSVWATALVLAPGLDAGAVVAARRFDAPTNRLEIDRGYDPHVRAELLVEVLERYVESGRLATHLQSEDQAETYYIIHPVLKHIAILAGDGG